MVRSRLAAPLALLCVFLAAGCGQNQPPAGSDTNAPGPDAPWTGETGSLRVTVVWPPPGAAEPRGIPDGTQSIGLRLFIARTGFELTGLPGMEGLPINKPTGAPPWPNQTVEISGVPAVETRFEARAFSGPGATGDELAVCIRLVSVLSEFTPGTNPTPVDMALGVPQPAATPSALDFGAGRVSLALDITNAVDTGPGTLLWDASADETWVAMSPTSGVDAGTVTVTVSRDGLAEGTHTATITIGSNHGSAAVDVSLQIGWGLADTAWPMFGHDPQQTRRSPYVGAQTATKRWEIDIGQPIWSSPAIGSDGTVYIGSNASKLHAVAPDGTEDWNYPTSAFVRFAPAVTADGGLCFGDNLGIFRALNPDGTLRWESATQAPWAGGPVVSADGMIYVGASDNKLYAIGANGVRRWWFTAGGAVSSPAIGTDGSIYFTSGDGKLYALDPNGAKRWDYALGASYGSIPAIGSDGTVYVGGGESGRLLSVHADGSGGWECATGPYITSNLAIAADGTLYVGCDDGKLYAVDSAGAPKWDFTTGGAISSSPAVGADGTVYVGSAGGSIYAISADGSQKWQFPTGGPVNSSPAIGADGTVYCGSDDGKVYAIGP